MSANVACPVAGASVERGKNSYHALKRARRRSTSTSTGARRVATGSRRPVRQKSCSICCAPPCSGSTSCRSGTWPSTCAGSASGKWPRALVSPASSRACRSASAAASSPLACWRAAATRRDPICRSTVTSTFISGGAASLSSMPCSHVPRWSNQPTTWYCQRPSSSGTNVASKRSLPRAAIGISRQALRPNR